MTTEQQQRMAFMDHIEQASKDLVQLTGVDIPEGYEPGKLKEMKKSWELKGYKLFQTLKGNKSILWLDFKGEFIGGYIVELDLTFNVVRRNLIENAGKLKEELKK